MRLTIVGSTGQTGRCVIAEALSRGHVVTATTRRPETLADVDGITVLHGDGRDRDTMRQAVHGADAVIAIVAASSRRGPHHISAVARTLTAVMAEMGARRLILTSAYPIVGDRPRIPIALLRLAFAASYADARDMEQHVAATDLDWTVVRLNRLTNGRPTGRPRVTTRLFDRPTPVSRADAATVLLDLADRSAHLRTCVNVAGP